MSAWCWGTAVRDRAGRVRPAYVYGCRICGAKAEVRFTKAASLASWHKVRAAMRKKRGIE
jgi:predicted nucleic acid-binding Zn ribbon protein